jgi:hypothetical protein
MDNDDALRELKGHFDASTGFTLRILYPAALFAFCFAPSLQSPLPVASVTSHDRGALALGSICLLSKLPDLERWSLGHLSEHLDSQSGP